MQSHEANHLPYLDGWRGLAILLLLTGHFFPVTGINLGLVGVNLFFVLSGLLMARLLFIKRVELPTFYRRRIARIIPSVLVYLGLVTLWFGVTDRGIDWVQVTAAASFTNNYFQSLDGAMPLGHIWSLSVEEHSYVVLSLIAFLARKGLIRANHAVAAASMGMLLCAFLYWAAVSEAALAREFRMHSEVAAFGIFASAFLVIAWNGIKPASSSFMAPAFVAIGILAHWWSVPTALKVAMGCGCFALAINMLDRAPGIIRAALEIPALRKLGTWSFSLYLWQQPFYLMVHHEGMSPLAGAAAALAVGIAAHYAIENPARVYINRVWTGRAPVPAEAVAVV